ncbi:MAG: type II toxin-antitoxin system death-on-curing family toxin [Pseudomonadota bacterium]|nr:type II toxin-antitoxin system death-on-curing family toxin [Pseudomonadota bacterium]
MTEPRWIRREVLLLLHDESLAEHGGASGLRDEGLLDSALARPRNRHAYGDDCDLADLAAEYAYGLARNHPFVDGNKRAALLSIGLFLGLNGYRLVAGQAEATLTILTLAAGELPLDELASWIRDNGRRRD